MMTLPVLHVSTSDGAFTKLDKSFDIACLLLCHLGHLGHVYYVYYDLEFFQDRCTLYYFLRLG